MVIVSSPFKINELEIISKIVGKLLANLPLKTRLKFKRLTLQSF